MITPLFLLHVALAAPGDDLLRTVVAEVALAQQSREDPAWNPKQRDCAGLVRFAYKSAYKALRPARLATPLFENNAGVPADFADAQTLIARSFFAIGRDDVARAQLRTGDVLAYRQDDGDGDVAWHLMLAVVAEPSSRGASAHDASIRVVYHPGEPGAAVRSGALLELMTDAPRAWRPTADNANFVGFFRFKEWTQ